jgi:hypothetical protein
MTRLQWNATEIDNNSTYMESQQLSLIINPVEGRIQGDQEKDETVGHTQVGISSWL